MLERAVQLEHPDVVQQRGEVEPLESLRIEAEGAAQAVGGGGDVDAVARVIAEVRVEGRDQDVGHVREEVPLGLVELGVAKRDRGETGQRRERVHLRGVELAARLVVDHQQGAERRRVARQRHRRAGGKARAGAREHGAPAAQHQLGRLADRRAVRLVQLLRVVPRRDEQRGRAARFAGGEHVGGPRLRDRERRSHGGHGRVAAVLGRGEAARDREQRGESMVVAVHLPQRAARDPAQDQEGAARRAARSRRPAPAGRRRAGCRDWSGARSARPRRRAR